MAMTWDYSMAALSAVKSVGVTVEVMAAMMVETKVEWTAVSLVAWWVELTDCEEVATMAALTAEKTAVDLDSTMVLT